MVDNFFGPGARLPPHIKQKLQENSLENDERWKWLWRNFELLPNQITQYLFFVSKSRLLRMKIFNGNFRENFENVGVFLVKHNWFFVWWGNWHFPPLIMWKHVQFWGVLSEKKNQGSNIYHRYLQLRPAPKAEFFSNCSLCLEVGRKCLEVGRVCPPLCREEGGSGPASSSSPPPLAASANRAAPALRPWLPHHWRRCLPPEHREEMGPECRQSSPGGDAGPSERGGGGPPWSTAS